MKKDIVVAWTPFNNFLFPTKGWRPGLPHPVLQYDWILSRYNVWKQYTYPSIAAQSGDFLYLIFCNILSKNLTDLVFKSTVLADSRVRLIYHACSGYFAALKKIREKHDTSYAVRIDSDDSYANDTFKYILEGFPPYSNAGFFLRGYGYYHERKELYKYNCINSGPFYVVKYPKGMYRFDPIDHTYLKMMGAAELGDGYFMVNIHGTNHSSAIKKPYFEERIYDKTKILKRFSHENSNA